jgi:hypothetical protein
MVLAPCCEGAPLGEAEPDLSSTGPESPEERPD